ncbi:MAG: hypothetical protein IPK74_22770 [Deltaproteobacteria bacterium]|nr:hypothetical protein [Deltaproteobacteria bacterium]
MPDAGCRMPDAGVLIVHEHRTRTLPASSRGFEDLLARMGISLRHRRPCAPRDVSTAVRPRAAGRGIEANLRLSFAADLRDHGVGAQMLHQLGVWRLELLTNNPRKIAGLSGFDMAIVEPVPLHAGKNPHNERYLATKVAKLGHLADG